MKKLLFFLSILPLLISCNKEKEDEQEQRQDHLNRTVLVYISGENNLSPFIYDDELSELRQGSQNIGANALVLYVDDASQSHTPYIIRLKDGLTEDSVALPSDPISSTSETMSFVLNYVATHYPADDYGLVLWGHASGWAFEDSIAASRPNRAYGLDNGKNIQSFHGKWMNMPTLAQTLIQWGKPLRFIFADCCQFQCVESAYELRNTTDYIIGSPAEIPGEGAPYHTLTKSLFDCSETFYKGIVDRYFEQQIDGLRVPLSVIKTSSLESLAKATNKALKAIDNIGTNPDLQGLIYYRGNIKQERQNVMYDMNDFMLRYAPEDIYKQWKTCLDSTVVYKTFTPSWMTNGHVFFPNFTMTEERYGGISMFIPQERPQSRYLPYKDNGIDFDGYNKDIRKTAWYWAAALNELGW